MSVGISLRLSNFSSLFANITYYYWHYESWNNIALTLQHCLMYVTCQLPRFLSVCQSLFLSLSLSLSLCGPARANRLKLIQTIMYACQFFKLNLFTFKQLYKWKHQTVSPSVSRSGKRLQAYFFFFFYLFPCPPAFVNRLQLVSSIVFSREHATLHLAMLVRLKYFWNTVFFSFKL